MPLCSFTREVDSRRDSLQSSFDHQSREVESDGAEYEPSHVSPVWDVELSPLHDVEPVGV